MKAKTLMEMTLEELWQLFPIQLVPHRPCWRQWYEEESARLQALLPNAVRLSHIGSTAISTIWAKPIVDILAEAPMECDWELLRQMLLDAGYLQMSSEKNRISFNKGYTEQGFAEKVFHLHLRRRGDADELYFRDYLIDHPEAAKEYERLKLKLWKQFEHNRDQYTESKTALIKHYTAEAKRVYPEKG